GSRWIHSRRRRYQGAATVQARALSAAITIGNDGAISEIGELVGARPDRPGESVGAAVGAPGSPGVPARREQRTWNLPRQESSDRGRRCLCIVIAPDEAGARVPA